MFQRALSYRLTLLFHLLSAAVAMPACPNIDVAVVNDLARAPDWSSIRQLRTVSGLRGGVVLAHYAANGAAFLAIDAAGVRRSVVVLKEPSREVIAAAIVYQPGCKLSMRFAGESPQAVNLVDVDVVGVRVGTWVVLFHTEQTRARSALSFRVEHDDRLRFLITGLAPGGWDVWRNGWLENDTAGVEPKEAVLFFEAPAGSFFIRSLN